MKSAERAGAALTLGIPVAAFLILGLWISDFSLAAKFALTGIVGGLCLGVPLFIIWTAPINEDEPEPLVRDPRPPV